MTSDALKITESRLALKPLRADEWSAFKLNAKIASDIYELRTQAGLTQKQLAALVGTKPSVISRLEDVEYTGHSLSILRKIAMALGRDLDLRFPSRTRR